jgi:4-methylaminobutanoate oxidase (formaldehyde-forming)
MDKPGGFIGREALLRQKQDGLTRRLVQFALRDPLPLLYHNEPIWRDGAIVGRISSGMFGHTVGRSLGMGYVTNAHGLADDAFIRAGSYEVEVAGVRVPADAALGPWYDPASLRVKDATTAKGA